jgi:hypothetical protein
MDLKIFQGLPKFGPHSRKRGLSGFILSSEHIKNK